MIYTGVSIFGQSLSLGLYMDSGLLGFYDLSNDRNEIMEYKKFMDSHKFYTLNELELKLKDFLKRIDSEVLYIKSFDNFSATVSFDSKHDTDSSWKKTDVSKTTFKNLDNLKSMSLSLFVECLINELNKNRNKQKLLTSPFMIGLLDQNTLSLFSLLNPDVFLFNIAGHSV